MLGVEVIIAVTVVLVIFGLTEALLHRLRRDRIPVRIHVNGTRGKSSVTRLIAAGLRAGGVRCCAKTTGTLPRFILPNGRELPVARASRPNIIEQMQVIATMVAHRADAIVVECMALQPELQWLSESKFVRATHGVVTNVRPDHLDVMGPDVRGVGLALAGTTPIGGVLFTAEHDELAPLEAAARDRGSELVHVDEEAVAQITEEDLAGFDYFEHAENVALALAVCTRLGVERDVALRGMHAAQPDPGVLREHTLDFFGRHICFVNAFAANDPVSTERLWRMALDRHPEYERKVAVFNCRADRAQRSVQLAEAFAGWPAADAVALMGTGTYIFSRAAEAAGLDPSLLYFAEDARADEVFETLIGMVGRSALIVGMGNIGGQGLRLGEYFAHRAEIA